MSHEIWPEGLGPVLCVVGARPNFMKMAPVLRAFANHRTSRPIRLRVHRRIRLQLAHNFRNLIPCNDREPSAHDEPPLILLRVRPAALDFSVIRFRDSYKEGRWNLIYFIRFPGFV